MLLFNFKLLQICSFPHFSPTCFDILSSNFVYDFVLMYHRASLSVVILQQFLLELCLFVNLEYSKYSVFRTFLLHALTYWAEILHMTLFYCTTDQVRVSSICVNFCGSYAPFYTPVFRRDVLWYGDVCPSGSPSVRLSVRPSGSPSASFPHFSPTCFDILSWNFAYDFVSLYYRSSLSVVNFRQVLCELCPFCNLQYWKYTVFRTFLQHALTYWAEILHMTLFYCTTEQVRVSSISVNFCGSYAPFVTYNTGNAQFSAFFSYMLWHIELKFCTWLCYTVLQIKFECC